MNPEALILRNFLSPGDVLVMSAAVHSLHKTYPGKYLIRCDTSCPAIWEHNPDIATPEQLAACGVPRTVEMHYGLIDSCNQRAVHMMQGYCDHLATILGVPVPVMTNKPILHLSAEERGWMGQVEEMLGRNVKFWIVCAGRKSDYTAKFWGTDQYQRVVDSLRGRVQFVQVGSAEHHHPALKNVINLVGKTDLRQLIRLSWHASGVLCGVTLMMHMAAALDKPSVVVAGGREPVGWNVYPRQQYLHTVGSLSCCRDGGCWKSRVVRLNDGLDQDSSLCENPVYGEEPIPKCLALIKPESVAEKILLTMS